MSVAAYSPLEQFAILPILPVHLGSVYVSFTNSALIMAVGVGLVCALFSMTLSQGGTLVPSHWQSCVEMLYEFVTALVDEQIGEKGQPYFPLIFTTFAFILMCNLIGMIPYSFTATSHFIVTLGLALSLALGMLIIGFATHGLHFFALLMPPGAPIALAPLLVLLELLSYVSKFISLGVRLGANMLAVLGRLWVLGLPGVDPIIDAIQALTHGTKCVFNKLHPWTLVPRWVLRNPTGQVIAKVRVTHRAYTKLQR